MSTLHRSQYKEDAIMQDRAELVGLALRRVTSRITERTNAWAALNGVADEISSLLDKELKEQEAIEADMALDLD